jgi:hypothetical protein
MSPPQLRGQSLPGSTRSCGRVFGVAWPPQAERGRADCGPVPPAAGGRSPRWRSRAAGRAPGACAMRAARQPPPRRPLASARAPCPARVRTIGSRGRHPERSAARLARNRSCPGAIRRRGTGRRAHVALSRTRRASHGVGPGHETPAAVTAATAKTPLQIRCPRRTPGASAVTAKTPKSGLEITAAPRAFSPASNVAQRDGGMMGWTF